MMFTSLAMWWVLIRSFDAVTAYLFHLTDDWDEILSLADKYYDEWLTDMNSIDVEFIPHVYPGFDKTHSKFYRDEPVLVRNVERFSNFCNIARLYVDDDINMVIVTTWNEWHEGTTIEPAIEYDFEYLQVIKTTLAGCRLLDLEARVSVERGYKFFGEDLWDEAKGEYRECPLGSGLENNYWGDDNYLALIFHRDYERFKESERANRIQKFLEKSPPRLELGLRRWCVLSADKYT